MRRVVRIFPLLTSLAVLSACVRAPEPENPELDSRTSSDASSSDVASPAAERPFGVEAPVALRARREGGKIRVSVVNLTAKPIVVGPKNFGVIVPGVRQVFAIVDPAQEFPVARLKIGGAATGLLECRETDLVEGARLVFNHPATGPLLAEIR